MALGDSRDGLAERVAKAEAAPATEFEYFAKEVTKEVLVAFARNPHLQEGDLLRLLERRTLPAEVLREVAARPETSRSYTLKLALARHPKTPRLLSLPLLKFLYLFDLVRVAETPAVPSEVKLAAENAILKKLETIPRGEKITLARRASGRVASGLLLTEDADLIPAALDNPFLSEAHLLKVLAHENLPPVVVESIARHNRWSHRHLVRLALIRNPRTPFKCMLEFLPDMTVADLMDICLDQRMTESVRKYVLAHCAARRCGPANEPQA